MASAEAMDGQDECKAATEAVAPAAPYTWRIGTLNIANAMRDELSEHRFGLRMDAIVAFLHEHAADVDVLCLQELRTCSNKEGTGVLTPLDIAYTMAKALRMEFRLQARNSDASVSFYQAVLFRPERVFATGAEAVWPAAAKERGHDCPNGGAWGAMAFKVSFVATKDWTRDPMLSAAPSDVCKFAVWNCHTPLLEDQRLAWTEGLCDLAMDPRQTHILAGDFNTIPECGAYKQLSKLASTFEVYFSQDPTFRSYPGDVRKSTGEPFVNMLDHVLLKPSGSDTDGFTTTVSTEVVRTPLSVSDHSLVVATVVMSHT